MSESQPCDNFKVDMMDNAMGPEQRCKNCKCAKKFHTMSNSAPAAKNVGEVASRIAQLQSKFSGSVQQNQNYVPFTKKPSVELNKQQFTKKANSIETKEESPVKQFDQTKNTFQQSQQEKIVQNVNITTTPLDTKPIEVIKETKIEANPQIIKSSPQPAPQKVEIKQDNTQIKQELKKEKVDVEFNQPKIIQSSPQPAPQKIETKQDNIQIEQEQIKKEKVDVEFNQPKIIQSSPQPTPQNIETKQDKIQIEQEQIKKEEKDISFDQPPKRASLQNKIRITEIKENPTQEDTQKEKKDIEFDQPPKRFSLQNQVRITEVKEDPKQEDTQKEKKQTSNSPKVSPKNELDLPEPQTRMKSQTIGSRMVGLPIRFGPPPVKKEKSIFDEAQSGNVTEQLVDRPVIKRNQKRDIDYTFLDD